MKHSLNKGISIVEIIVASAIISVSVIGIVGAIQVYLKIVYQNTRETQAVLLLDESAEALQYLRDDSYETYITDSDLNTPYSLFWNGTGYELGTSTITLPYEMTRTVTFTEVRRSSSDQIVLSGGDVDDDTVVANIDISWPYKDATTTISSQVLLHNIYDN